VYPIAAPKGEDKTHHYLWRFWRRLKPPDEKQILIFDRSWYGRVMVERLEGFCDALEKHGCAPSEEMIGRGAYTFESGIACARTLLERPEPPTAIFASNDEMAIGVIYAAQEMGMKVPGDLSVAGFDDSNLATRIRPSLTTIRRPVREMARLATTKLIASIDGREEDARVGIFLDPVLIIRNSTRSIQWWRVENSEPQR